MTGNSWTGRVAVATGLAFAAGPAGAVEAPPLAGCYARVYDAAHLSRHKDQFVTRISLSVAAASRAMADTQGTGGSPIVAQGKLRMWVRGHRQSFDSHGACAATDSGLMCGGSLSAAEADTCKSRRDGVRDCRVDPADSGSFKIEARPDGILVSIAERLELVPAPYDGGPFLSISPANSENRAFLLKSAPDACK